jgi:hypothetical protein
MPLSCHGLRLHSVTRLKESRETFSRTETWDEVRIMTCKIATRFNQMLSADFPVTVFLDHMCNLAQHRTQSHAGKNPDTQFSVPKVEVTDTLQQFQLSLEYYSAKLLQVYAFHVRHSPKRRSVSEESASTMYVAIIVTCPGKPA